MKHMLFGSLRRWLRERRKLANVRRVWGCDRLPPLPAPSGSCFIMLCLKLNITKLHRVRRANTTQLNVCNPQNICRVRRENQRQGKRLHVMLVEKWLNFVMHLLRNNAGDACLQKIVDFIFFENFIRFVRNFLLVYLMQYINCEFSQSNTW